jgi:hypothetical protein
VAHEELIKQYKEDCKKYDRPWDLWEYMDYRCSSWEPCWNEPKWHPHNKYRRKETPFKPEYFSGLNWREALPLVGRLVEASINGESWHGPFELKTIDDMPEDLYKYHCCRQAYPYIRTCPETYQGAHPTITIGGVELPMPETKTPERETPVYVVNGSFVKTYFWSGNWNYERCDLEDGKIHLTESRAQAWADWWTEHVIKQIRP